MEINTLNLFLSFLKAKKSIKNKTNLAEKLGYRRETISRFLNGSYENPKEIEAVMIQTFKNEWQEFIGIETDAFKKDQEEKNAGLSLEEKIMKLEKELLATNSLLDEAGKLIHNLLQRVGDLEEGISHSTSNTSNKIAADARSAQKAKSKH